MLLPGLPPGSRIGFPSGPGSLTSDLLSPYFPYCLHVVLSVPIRPLRPIRRHLLSPSAFWTIACFPSAEQAPSFPCHAAAFFIRRPSFPTAQPLLDRPQSRS